MQYIAAIKATTLKSPLAPGASSMVVKALVDKQGNQLSSMAAVFGDWFVMVVQQGNTWEQIKCTDFSYNADLSANITIAPSGRNILPYAPFTGASTGQNFNISATCIVTNDMLTMLQFGNLNNTQTWLARQTFATVPQTTQDPVGGNDIVRNSYLMSVVLGTLTTINVKIPGTAGEDLTIGDLIYFDISSDSWKKTDATDTTTINGTLLGICLSTTLNTAAIDEGVLLQGLDTNQSGMTPGAVQYASDTPGAIAGTAGTNTLVVGAAKSATELMFSPRFNQVLSYDQVQALTGYPGSPSAANPFLTKSVLGGSSALTGATISFTASTHTIHDTAAGFITAGFAAGQIITVIGSASNNGNYTVVSVTSTDMIVTETLVDEAAGASVGISVYSPLGIAAIGGTGADGALNVTSGTTTLNAGQVYNFTTINVSPGATLAFTGTGAALLNATGAITIAGTIELGGLALTQFGVQTSRDFAQSGSPITVSPPGSLNIGGTGAGSAGHKGGDGGTSTTADGAPGLGGAGGSATSGGTSFPGSDGHHGNNSVGGGGGGGEGGTQSGSGPGANGGTSTTNDGGAGGNGGAAGSFGSGGQGGGGGGGFNTGNGGGAGTPAPSGGGGAPGSNGGASGSNGGNGGAGSKGADGGGSGGSGGNGGNGGNGYMDGGAAGAGGSASSTSTGGAGGNGGHALNGTGGAGGAGGNGGGTGSQGGNGGVGGNSRFGNGGVGGNGGSGGGSSGVGGNGGNGGNGRNGGNGGDGHSNGTPGVGGNGGNGSNGAIPLVIYGASTLSFTGVINAQGGNGGNGGNGGANNSGVRNVHGGNGGNAGDGADVIMVALGAVTNSGVINNQAGTPGTRGLGSFGDGTNSTIFRDGKAGRNGATVVAKFLAM